MTKNKSNTKQPNRLPLTFNEVNHLTAINFNETHCAITSNKANYTSKNIREIKKFEVNWEEIPEFAIITGKNGSGKSYLLDIIKNYITKQRDIKFTYFGAEKIDRLDIMNNRNIYNDSLRDEFKYGYRNNPEIVKKQIFINIRKQIDKPLSNKELSKLKLKSKGVDNNIAKETAKALIKLSDTNLREKDDYYIKQFIKDTCKDNTCINGKNLSQINYSESMILETAVKDFEDYKSDYRNDLIRHSNILGEPYQYWCEKKIMGIRTLISLTSFCKMILK